MNIDPERPLSLLIRVEATNGTATLSAVEEICKRLKEFQFPQNGAVLESPIWRVTILESKNQL